MRLFLVRHAEAAPGSPDELRTLTPAGREQAREVAERLAGEAPDVVLTSPLLRARETADAIARAAGAPLRVEEGLTSGASPQQMLATLEGAGETVVAVGHEPDCGDFAAEVTGETRRFRPAEVAELHLS